MSYNIAVAGKGGTGKTSLTGILIDYLTKEKKGEILVVDADANASLDVVHNNGLCVDSSAASGGAVANVSDSNSSIPER